MVDAAWISQKTLRLASAPAAIHCKARRLKRCTAPRQVWVAQAGVGGPGRCGRVSEPEVVGLALGQVDVDVIDALDRHRGNARYTQNSAFDLAFNNGASKSNSLSVGCGRPSNISNKCYHASSNRRVGG